MQPEKKSDKKVDEEYKPISSSDEDEPKEATKIEEPKKEETKIEVEPTQPSAWSELSGNDGFAIWLRGSLTKDFNYGCLAHLILRISESL